MSAAITTEQLPPSTIAAYACPEGCTGPLAYIYLDNKEDAKTFQHLYEQGQPPKCRCCGTPMQPIKQAAEGGEKTGQEVIA